MAIDRYDATIEGVDALLVWDVTRSDHPTEAEIETWFDMAAAAVGAQTGALDGGCDDEGFRARAAHLVHVWVAAMADDAHYPERTGDADRYAEVLRKQFATGLAVLAADAQACREGTYGGVRSGGAHSFPKPPLFTRCMGF